MMKVKSSNIRNKNSKKNIFMNKNLTKSEIELLECLQKLQDKEKRTKIIYRIILGIIIFIFLLGFLWIYKNKDFIYELYGESENFAYNTALFVKAGPEYHFIPGNEKIKNPNIDEEDIISVTLKCNKRLIVGTDEFLDQSLVERKGYDELFPKEVVNNIDDWYFEIKYTLDKEIHTEILKLKYKDLNKN